MYFQLRRQEILSPLEEIDDNEDKSSPSRPVSKNDTTSLTFSTAVWKAITKCWAENVYLPVLTDRFLILSIQIFGRYLDWLCGFSSLSSKDGATMKIFVHALHDCKILRDRISRFSLPDSECVETFREISFDRPEKILFDSLVASLSSSCESALRAVSSIAASFRMTSKAMPTEHSNFLPSILRPLSHFVRVWGKANYVETKLLERLVESVLTRVIRKYEIVVTEMMDSVRKTEESLSRLRRLRTSDKRGDSSDNDSTSKIRKQLHLDLDFFTEQITLLLSEGCITKDIQRRVVDAVSSFKGRI